MEVIFQYNPDKEYENFRAAFSSSNHREPSPRQRLFFSQYRKLTRKNAREFAARYIAENKISIPSLLVAIEQKWRPLESTFFKRADAIFKRPLPQKTITAFLTIHDRCAYSFERNEFYIHLNLATTNKTIMHELWHWYFYYTVGRQIEKEKGKKTFNDVKESLTVLLNTAYSDLLHGAVDRGYPQHAKLRELIQKTYTETSDVYLTIDRAASTL